MKMIVTKPFRPKGSGSRQLQVGETYVASDKRQAKLYRAMGWAVDAPVEAPAPPPVAAVPQRAPRARAVIAAPVAEVVESAPAQPAGELAAEPVVESPAPAPVADAPPDESVPADKPKRAYRRRDLTSE
jgi:hypothetical protein